MLNYNPTNRIFKGDAGMRAYTRHRKRKHIIVYDDDLSSYSPRKPGRPSRDGVMNDKFNYVFQ